MRKGINDPSGLDDWKKFEKYYSKLLIMGYILNKKIYILSIFQNTNYENQIILQMVSSQKDFCII